ncbi:MAG: hypothetical protein R3C26_10715 [Calditrichia bacterium]
MAVFRKGACLALTYAASHPQKFGGIVALSGGLIGPPGNVFDFPRIALQNTCFLGCSDVDFHIRPNASANLPLFRKNGRRCLSRFYPGMGHTVNIDEIRQTQS